MHTHAQNHQSNKFVHLNFLKHLGSYPLFIETCGILTSYKFHIHNMHICRLYYNIFFIHINLKSKTNCPKPVLVVMFQCSTIHPKKKPIKVFSNIKTNNFFLFQNFTLCNIITTDNIILFELYIFTIQFLKSQIFIFHVMVDRIYYKHSVGINISQTPLYCTTSLTTSQCLV